MRDHQQSPSAATSIRPRDDARGESGHGLVHDRLGRLVERRVGLVKQQQLSVHEQRAGETQRLPLTLTQTLPLTDQSKGRRHLLAILV